MRNPDSTAEWQGATQLLSLLRTGEQSAQYAFGSLQRRLAPGSSALAGGILEQIGRDEARHDRLLAEAAQAAGLATLRAPAAVRRFFIDLQSREISVHLARIASLDGCVCQLLSAVLAPTAVAALPWAMRPALASIRADEGRHVRASRYLVRAFGLSDSRQQQIRAETRYAFVRTLDGYSDALAALHIDPIRVRQRLLRHGD